MKAIEMQRFGRFHSQLNVAPAAILGVIGGIITGCLERGGCDPGLALPLGFQDLVERRVPAETRRSSLRPAWAWAQRDPEAR